LAQAGAGGGIVSKSIAAAVVAQVVPALQRECRTAVLFSEPVTRLPDPHDDDAEQELLSAVLSGEVHPSELDPLRAEHFRAHIKQQTFAAADALTIFGASVTVPAVTELLVQEGYNHTAVQSELELIRDATPFLCRATLQERVQRVIELWQLRQLLRVMDEIAAHVRVGQLTHAGAKARLREYFMGVGK
jgi:hypothetical protein